jgi:hypothetical protein
LRRLPIRTKLAVALAVPLLALIAVTVLEVVKTSSEVDDIGRQTDLARSAIGPSGIITALQNERTWLAVELIGSQGQVTVPVEGYDETRAQTDEAIESFRDDVRQRSGNVAEVFQEPLAGLDALADVRNDVDASTQPRDPTNIEFAGQIFDRYTELIDRSSAPRPASRWPSTTRCCARAPSWPMRWHARSRRCPCCCGR